MDRKTFTLARRSADDLAAEIEQILDNSPDIEVTVRKVADDFVLSFRATPMEVAVIAGYYVED